MATLLLLDGVSCSNQQQAGGACSFLSSLQHRLDLCYPSPPSLHGCDRPCEPLSSTVRCASSNNLLDRLDPPLPRFSNNYLNKHPGVSGPRLILETRPTLSQPYRDEPFDTLVQPSSPGNADTSSQKRIISEGQEVDVKRNQRVSPSYLSVSQTRRATVIQAAAAPLQMKDLKDCMHKLRWLWQKSLQAMQGKGKHHMGGEVEAHRHMPIMFRCSFKEVPRLWRVSRKE